jgi:hypothetical protein
MTDTLNIDKGKNEEITGFTPGPWFRGSWSGKCHINHKHGSDKCKYDYTLNNSGDYFSRFVSAGSPNSPIEVIGSDDYGPILSEPNARLIASAPTMYAELQSLKDRNERLENILKEAQHHIDTWSDEPIRATRLISKIISKALSDNETKTKEIYIKISMGQLNHNVICISFHQASHKLNYPFK